MRVNISDRIIGSSDPIFQKYGTGHELPKVSVLVQKLYNG
jgi:hypothetical protein